MVLTIVFNDGRKFISHPITVGDDKKVSRLKETVEEIALAAADAQDRAKDLETSADSAESRAAAREIIGQYNNMKETGHKAVEERDRLIVSIFDNRFTLDDLDNCVSKEELDRIMRALTGLKETAAEKNA